jgi:hypothetical protein
VYSAISAKSKKSKKATSKPKKSKSGNKKGKNRQDININFNGIDGKKGKEETEADGEEEESATK